ncbi:MAG: hypothetical protein HY226_05735 [Candidatus Vogelbacteria bacterium]|nr:hypothetical protein [Candidatus Vogelbacteria bacterium]
MQEKRNVNKKTKRLSDEIITFYITELTLSGTENLTTCLKLDGKELSSQDQVKLTCLRVKASRTINHIFKWVREYLVYAVYSELENQDTLPENHYVEFPKLNYPKGSNAIDKVDKFLMYATEAEVCAYLKRAAIRFNQKGWSVGFGGKKWAVIAKIASEMWSTNLLKQKCLLIDRTFQIEHNGGMIFDKRPSKVMPDEDKDKEILNIKKRACDIDTLLRRLKTKATSNETKKLISKLVETLKSLENGKRKNSLGGD